MGRPKGSKNGTRVVRTKSCELCKAKFVANYPNYHRVRFCSRSCGVKSRPPGRLGTKGSEKQKAVMRAKKGELHPRWINDRTTVVGRHNRSFHDSDMKRWRIGVYQRDNYKCKIADTSCRGRLEAHHILVWKDYPELRYEINNGITLCHYHHPKTRQKESELVDYFLGLLTP